MQSTRYAKDHAKNQACKAPGRFGGCQLRHRVCLLSICAESINLYEVLFQSTRLASTQQASCVSKCVSKCVPKCVSK